jgi:arylsulfatase A-like enzyme
MSCHGHPILRTPNIDRLHNAARFLGMVANIDDNIGRLLAKLREWDLVGPGTSGRRYP